MFKIPCSSSEGRGGRALRQGQPTYLAAFFSGGKALLGEGGSFPGAAQEVSSSPNARHRRRQMPTPLRPLVRACGQHWAPSLPLFAVRFQASLLPSLSSVCSVLREGTKLKDAAAALPLNPAGLRAQRDWEEENGPLSCQPGAGAFLPLLSCNRHSEEVRQVLKSKTLQSDRPGAPPTSCVTLALVSSSVKSWISLRLLQGL